MCRFSGFLILVIGLWAVGWHTGRPGAALELEIVPDCVGCTHTELHSILQRDSTDLPDWPELELYPRLLDGIHDSDPWIRVDGIHGSGSG